jgi:DNA adenine methylase
MDRVQNVPAERRGSTPITYYGGKQRMIQHIIPMIPRHLTYVEPFFGGGAVFFAKDISSAEIINDLNGEVSNFFQQCKSSFSELRRMIAGTDVYSRIDHRKAALIYDNPLCFTPTERAWAFWIQTNFSFTAKIKGGWAYELKSNGIARRFRKKQESFDSKIRDRLKTVYVENKNAVELIKCADSEETFFYVDPPYPQSNQGHYSGYSMSDFEALLSVLSSIKGRFLLSSYPYPELSAHAKKHGWNQKEIVQQLCALAGKARSGRKKTECLTWNYDL